MWQQADKNQMTLRSLEGNGWKIIDQATLEIDWDSKENVETVHHRVALLTKGCNCKIGCRTARCGCVKRNGKCGAECNCQNCCNLPIPSISEDLVDMAIAERTNRNHDCFFPGDVGYRHRKYCFLISHAYRPYLVMPRAVSTAHARAQYR